MPPDPQVQSYLVAAGLVAVGVFGIVVVWKITKSLLKLFFWFAVLFAVAFAAWWLLAREGLAPDMRPPEPVRPVPVKQTVAKVGRADRIGG